MFIKHFRSSLLVIFGFLIFAGSLRANYHTRYVWYQPIPEENRVVITVESVWGREAVERFEQNLERLENDEGKYYLNTHYGPDSPSRSVIREEKLGDYDIRTQITIDYPRGLGFGGALPWVYIKVYVDGVLHMDTPLGYNHQYALTVPKVVIHGCPSYGFIKAHVLYSPPGRFGDTMPFPEVRTWFDDSRMLKIHYGAMTNIPR